MQPVHAVARPAGRQSITFSRCREPGFAGSTLLLSLLLLGAASPVASAQGTGNAIAASASVSGFGEFRTNLDGNGGNFDMAAVLANANLSTRIDDRWSLAFSVGYVFEDWSFSSPTAFGGTAPWGKINRPSVGFNVAYQAASDISVFVAPQFEWDYETGANANGQNFGAVIGASKIFSRDHVLGLGVGVFHQIDTTKVFPFLIVDWKIDDRWRLSNPFRGGPTGGAGLELGYALDDNWELAGGGTYRDYRFRLASSGPNPNGIGQNQGIPLFARLTRKLGPKARLDLYGGAVVAGTLKLRNSSGDTLVSSDYNAAPFLALTLAADF